MEAYGKSETNLGEVTASALAGAALHQFFKKNHTISSHESQKHCPNSGNTIQKGI